MSIWKKVGAETICIALIMIFFLPVCGFLYRCGCSTLWSSGVDHCNIHDPVPPDCPWCTGPLALQMITFVLVCLSGYGGIQGMRKIKSRQIFRDVAAGLLAAFLAAVFIAWVYSILLDYPLFFLASGK